MKRSGFGILIPFSISITLSEIARILFATTFVSRYSISITLHYVYAIVYASMVFHIINYISMDSCSSYATTFSSHASFFIVCASTK
jgi:hypothetical protein